MALAGITNRLQSEEEEEEEALWKELSCLGLSGARRGGRPAETGTRWSRRQAWGVKGPTWDQGERHPSSIKPRSDYARLSY